MKISASLLKSLWLFAIVLFIMLASGLPQWLVYALVLIFLALPLVREFRPKTELDERQIVISRFSSHIAFYTLLALASLVMVHDYISAGQEPDPALTMIIIVPLVIKFLISLFQNYDIQQVARWIVIFFGGIWILFALLSHGPGLEGIIEALPFLIIFASAFVIGRYPVPGAIVLIAMAVGLTLFFGGWMRLPNVYVRILMYVLIPLPLVLSALAILINKRTAAGE